ncbi:hypothetical protein MNBD_GAMMA12-1219 [hydrothermal vent metagenome]|uniref:DUF2007 domain-containing protein n=1 Tax=hydrothermal vent metagenome TaxID=652676 RepID=A0A3B0YZ98_9ZZZZ
MLVVVGWYSNVLEAHIIKGRLSACGIDATIQNEHHVTLDWSLMLAMGFIRVQVGRVDAAEACQILKDINDGEYDLEHNYSPEVEHMPDPPLLCPSCNSEDVSYGVISDSWIINYMTVVFVVFMFETILPIKNYSCECKKCSFKWKDKKEREFEWTSIVMIALIFSIPLSLAAYYLFLCRYTPHGFLCL